MVNKDLELFAEAGVGLPFPLELQYFPGVEIREVADDGDQAMAPLDFEARYGIAVLLVVVGDSFYLARKLGDHGSSIQCSRGQWPVISKQLPVTGYRGPVDEEW